MDMRKIVIWLVFVTLGTTTICAQSLQRVDKARQDEMVAKISEVSSAIRSLQCDFVQTKHLSMLNDKLISTGKMYYRQPDELRWEYLSPYSYIFILNSSNVLIRTGETTNTIDTSSSRLFQEITRMMMASVTGQSLVDTANFDVEMYIAGEDWVAELTPLKRDVRQMFARIKLYFNERLSTISHIEMQEASGDTMMIELKNTQINRPIDEALFTLD
jgi:outer membrane lipoprotein carrier protein